MRKNRIQMFKASSGNLLKTVTSKDTCVEHETLRRAAVCAVQEGQLGLIHLSHEGLAELCEDHRQDAESITDNTFHHLNDEQSHSHKFYYSSRPHSVRGGTRQ